MAEGLKAETGAAETLVSAQTPSLGCRWEMFCSTPPPTLILLTGDLSKYMPPARLLSCSSEC